MKNKKDKISINLILLIAAILLVMSIFCIFIFLTKENAGAMRNASRHKSTAINGSVVLNDSTFTLVVPENVNRDAFVICNLHPAISVYINFRSVIDSVDETGYMLEAGKCVPMLDIIYTGPITAIAAQNDVKISYLSW